MPSFIGAEYLLKYYIFLFFFFFLSYPDDGCKSNNPAKGAKKRPPGTVEFIVSKSHLNKLVVTHYQMVARCIFSGKRFMQLICSFAGGAD